MAVYQKMNPNPTTHCSSLQKDLQILPWIIGLAFIIWFSSLSTFHLGIDQEHAFLRTDERIWLEQGRWFIFFLNQYFYTQPIVGYFPNLVFILLSSFSYLLVVKSLNNQTDNSWIIILSSIVFTSHPFWYFIAEFYTNLIPAGIGLICCSYSMYLASRNKSSIIQIILIMTAIGNYQSFLLVMLSMYGILIINRIIYQEQKVELKPLVKKAIILVLAVSAHYLFLEILYKIYNTHASYTAQLINPQLFLETPLRVTKSVLTGAFFSYIGNEKIYGNNILFLGLLTTLGFFSIIYQAKRSKQIILCLITVAFLLLSPFLLQMAAGDFFGIALRVSVGLPLVAWYLTFSAFRILKTQQAQYILLGILILAGIQFSYLHAKYTTLKQLTLAHDKLIASQIFERISQLLPDDPKKATYTLLVQGGLPYTPPYPGVPTTALTGSFFWWDFGNAERIRNFMHILGYDGFHAYPYHKSIELIKELAPIYNQMPTWPAKDSIQLHQNFILIKFGKAQYYPTHHSD